MFQRERRSWTTVEDQLLREAVAKGKGSGPGTLSSIH